MTEPTEDTGAARLQITFSPDYVVNRTIPTEFFDELEIALERLQEGAGASIPALEGRLVLTPGSVLHVSVSSEFSLTMDSIEVDSLDFIDE